MTARREEPAIAITGVGLVGPLGHSAWQTFRALLEGRTVARRLGDLPETADAVALVRAIGAASISQHSAADPAVELAERAAREALHEAAADAAETPCILAASKGAMGALEAACLLHGEPAARVRRSGADPALPGDAALAVALGPHGYLAHHLEKRLGVRVHGNLVAACATSLSALHRARQWLQRPDGNDAARPRRMLVVTAEASLLPLFIHSYRRLGVLPPLTRTGYRGMPLDARRCGFMLAELGAAVVLERRRELNAGDIALLDTAVATEAFDLVRSAPGMPALARVARTLMGDRPVDLLHPHATGTVDHDPAELAVYAGVLGARSGATGVYACKGALGHGLGAAGLVSLVLACLCARTARRPPMPWLEQPIDTPLPIVGDAASLPRASTHAVFAAGFGGHVAGALLRRHG